MKKEKEKTAPAETNEKVLYVNRCSKVVKGGRKFSFSAVVLVSDGNGGVGFGFAKANELTEAIRKAGEAARADVKKYVTEGTTIPHEIQVDWDGATILLRPAKKGRGVVAGSMVRAVLEMAGIEDVTTKSIGGNNPINQVRATFKALSLLRSKEEIKQSRGIVCPA